MLAGFVGLSLSVKAIITQQQQSKFKADENGMNVNEMR